MRYGIIGTGAIGGYYGAKLAHGGQEVHFNTLSPIVIRLFKKILAVDASQHDMIDACPALNSSDSRHIRMNNARSHIINGYRSSFIAGRIKPVPVIHVLSLSILCATLIQFTKRTVFSVYSN